LASFIIGSNVEEENSPPYPKFVVMNLLEETMNSKDTTPVATPQSIMGSNELNYPPMALGSAQYVRNKVW